MSGLNVDVTKLVTLLLVVAGSIFLTATGKLDAQACVALLGAALGYVFGNSHGVGESQVAARSMKAYTETLRELAGGEADGKAG